MLTTKQKVLRRFWYAVMPLDDLASGPKPFRLLGEDIVLFLDGSGRPAALADRCCHRTAKLSKGWCQDGKLVCGYHGWTYDGDGSLVAVPGEDAYGPHFDKGRFGLVPVARLAAYRDFWFLNLDPAAQDLETYLAGTKDYIDLVTEQSPSGRLEIIAGVE